MNETPLNSPTVEFTCQSCGRQLKVPTSAAGKQATCPDCGNAQSVPAESSSSVNSYGAAPPTSASYGAAPTAGAGLPLADISPHQNPASPSDLASSILADPTGPSTPTPSSATPLHPSGPPTRDAGPSSEASPETSGQAHLEKPQAHQGDATPTKQLFDRIIEEIRKIFVGQDELVLGTLVALFSSGHVLIESVPGLGKTLFVRTLGRVLGCKFGRIQFTADLMPSDITGAPIFDMKRQEFDFRPGPVFTQMLLADEINRSPAKTHAALLEIMQEFRVTVDGTSHTLQRPFLVMATQNPIESEGTYNLPEAQLDRFMFKLVADYPHEAEEARILDMHSRQVDINRVLQSELNEVTNPDEIMAITRGASDIRVDPKLIDYINKIVRLTRQWPQLHMGASTRAGIALMQACRTLAAFRGRDYAVPDDVREVVLPALRHRVILSAEAEVEGRSADELLTDLINSVEVPRL